MKVYNWNIEELTGYKPVTTFYQDFSIAEKYGIDGIKDTYKRAFEEWKDDYKFLTDYMIHCGNERMNMRWKI